MRDTTGRCHQCRVRFIWQGKPLLKDAFCPYCGSKLQLTTHLWKGASERRKPLSRDEVKKDPVTGTKGKP